MTEVVVVHARRLLPVVLLLGSVGVTACANDSESSDESGPRGSDLALESVFALTGELGAGAGALGATSDTVVLISDLGAVYRSDDAVVWERGQGFPAKSFAGRPLDVAGGSAGWVAVATSSLDEAGDEFMVVFSEDGSQWAEIDQDGLPDSSKLEGLGLHQVVAGPTGFVAVGSNRDGAAVGWFSADGRTWIDTDLTDHVDVPSTPVILAADESRWVAVVGDAEGAELEAAPVDSTDIGPHEGDEPGDGEAGVPSRVFVSADGTSWSEIATAAPPPSILPAQQSYWWVAPFAILNDTWILAPPVGVEVPSVWVSTDQGITWEEHDIGSPFEPTDLEYVIEDMAASSDAVVVSFAQDVPGRAVPMLFSSNDGTSWTAHSTCAESHEIAVLGTTVVSAGDHGDVYIRSFDRAGLIGAGTPAN